MIPFLAILLVLIGMTGPAQANETTRELNGTFRAPGRLSPAAEARDPPREMWYRAG
jgi:hypothetical protein